MLRGLKLWLLVRIRVFIRCVVAISCYVLVRPHGRVYEIVTIGGVLFLRKLVTLHVGRDGLMKAMLRLCRCTIVVVTWVGSARYLFLVYIIVMVGDLLLGIEILVVTRTVLSVVLATVEV